MLTPPKVSVVIPCYNHGAFLDETVDSVLAQSFADFEIIIVDDGSTDPGTVRLLEGYRRPKTTVLRTANGGVSRARNTGIARARGSYILPLDADDRIAPTYMEKAVAILDARPEVGIVYCDEEKFGEEQGLWDLPPYDPVAELFDNLIHPAAFFRKSDWARVGGYSPMFVYGWEDWDFWVSMTRLNKEVSKIPEILYYYRVRSVSRDHSMCFGHKFAMMALIIMRHKTLYLRHAGALFKKITWLVRSRLASP
ncbi:glycosyltransferase [Geomonas subterranea]|uniref:Glycosyltransferase n=1 Tax=Geomonas subterranea TaxID=2847989 RepID=A0ABX8LN24_9BACT|nr:glycosyltransferase [Geomonas subterranea]QXE92337.1 glycosyltransferase [Geomonas subterranea]QXM09564.1 glycosyltransferase [Geomonas subterranea]